MGLLHFYGCEIPSLLFYFCAEQALTRCVATIAYLRSPDSVAVNLCRAHQDWTTKTRVGICPSFDPFFDDSITLTGVNRTAFSSEFYQDHVSH